MIGSGASSICGPGANLICRHEVEDASGASCKLEIRPTPERITGLMDHPAGDVVLSKNHCSTWLEFGAKRDGAACKFEEGMVERLLC